MCHLLPPVPFISKSSSLSSPKVQDSTVLRAETQGLTPQSPMMRPWARHFPSITQGPGNESTGKFCSEKISFVC